MYGCKILENEILGVFLPLPLVCKQANNSTTTTYMQENYAPLDGVSFFNQRL
jgi:hypothetical protein